MKTIRFYCRYAWFNLQEQFSDLGSGLTGFLLLPFFIWILGKMWGRFNAYQGNYTLREILLYVGVTEVLFMTFIRSSWLSREAGDFSLSLARPRSWLATGFAGLFGRCLGSRLVYLLLFLIIMPLLGVDMASTARTAGRLLLLLPILGVIQGLLGLAFASAQVLWAEIDYFVFPISKIFLALGGVFAPLVDFGEPWRSRLLSLFPADLFFQPGQFCVKGEFYQMGVGAWFLRISLWCCALFAFDLCFYHYARKHHQSYGG